MDDHCTHLKEFLEAEMLIVKRHIGEHKWFLHIEDKNEAIDDFIKKYAWLIRELYCARACPNRTNCAIAHEFLKEAGSE